MARFKETRNPLLKGIYKAGQCTDLRDVEIALAEIEQVKQQLKNVRGQSRAVFIRERSLQKRAKVLFEKSMRLEDHIRQQDYARRQRGKKSVR